MFKRIFILMLTSLFIFSLFSEDKRIITDTTGKNVELKKEIKRIAVVPIPWASIVYAIDGKGDRIVGMHPSSKKSYDECILKKMSPALSSVATNYVGSDFQMSMEEVIKLKADVMIVWDYQEKEIEQLKALGIPAVSLRYGTLEYLQKGILVIGNILNRQKAAEELVQYHKDTIKFFDKKKEKLEKLKKPKVLYMRDEQLKIAGKGSINNIFIESAGGVNVAKDVPGQWVNVTIEQIMAWDPEIIFMSNFSDFTPSDVLENKIKAQDWSKISAVKNKKVYKTPMGIYRWDAPCSETPLMMKWMAKIQQSEIFKEIDIEKEIKTFYKKFFNYDLNRNDLDWILQKKNNIESKK